MITGIAAAAKTVTQDLSRSDQDASNEESATPKDESVTPKNAKEAKPDA